MGLSLEIQQTHSDEHGNNYGQHVKIGTTIELGKIFVKHGKLGA